MTSAARTRARDGRVALLEGDLEEALRLLREGTASLGPRSGRRPEIDALWKAARRLLWATLRRPAAEHLRLHGCDRVERTTVETAQFDVGVLLEIAEARLTEQPRGKRWCRRALRELSRHEEPTDAWRRMTHLATRLTRADLGALFEVTEDALTIPVAVDPRGTPMPRHDVPVPAGAIRSCLTRGRERLPGWRSPDGGRILVVPVPGDPDRRLAMLLQRRGRAPRFGDERRAVLRAFLRRAGPEVVAAEQRRRDRESADRRRRDERHRRHERAEERARHRRFLLSLREAQRDEKTVRAALRFRYDRIVGASGAMSDVFRALDKVIPTELPLLIRGETGTGKELIARAIHDYGPRRGRSYVSLNASALPENLVEVELFGCRRGAYTDADSSRRGLLRDAHRGSFFLDEIGEMALAAQSRLLRALETRRVRPVGGGEEVEADVRLIAATHCDLEEMVAVGTFREDLYHRLRVVPIALPPLRERPGDLPLLVQHFIDVHGKPPRPEVSDEALERLRSHPWPGNVRELEMCLRVALVLCDGPALRSEHIQLHPPVQPRRELGFDLPAHVPLRQRRLLEEWSDSEPIRCGTYAARYGLSRRTASRDLSRLADMGLLERRGAGAGVRYRRVVAP